MAKFIVITILGVDGPEQQAINVDAITRFIPVKEEPDHPARSRIFLMGPAASEDRFECLHTFQELQDIINKSVDTSQIS
jgi:hypothetical protein